MLYLKDKSKTVWSNMSEDMETIVYDDGTREPLTMKHLEVQVGKYKGRTLAEVDDASYLKWMKQACEEKDATWDVLMISRRLKELGV
jgi:uncharacterized protein (DUF3820 family)